MTLMWPNPISLHMTLFFNVFLDLIQHIIIIIIIIIISSIIIMLSYRIYLRAQ